MEDKNEKLMEDTRKVRLLHNSTTIVIQWVYHVFEHNKLNDLDFISSPEEDPINPKSRKFLQEALQITGPYDSTSWGPPIVFRRPWKKKTWGPPWRACSPRLPDFTVPRQPITPRLALVCQVLQPTRQGTLLTFLSHSPHVNTIENNAQDDSKQQRTL